uniref:WRKY19-like zinc finger domain-containing protein n=1 Tax=Timema tahoe TaxID=61484 RepID=A0A7R9IM93_9NEOP|nr:unnamed protein product [Timema tahoe]
MEERARVSESENAESQRGCEVYIKEELDPEMEINAAEYVNVSIKSEVEENFEPDSQSAQPSYKQEHEMNKDGATVPGKSEGSRPCEESVSDGEPGDHFMVNGLETCEMGNCPRNALKDGHCKGHKVYARNRCRAENCSKCALRGGYCTKHGGTYYLRKCREGDCFKFPMTGGYCFAHGGIYTRRLCKEQDCSKQAKKGGYCIAHGGTPYQKMCSFEDCSKHAMKGGFCIAHGGTYY